MLLFFLLASCAVHLYVRVCTRASTCLRASVILACLRVLVYMHMGRCVHARVHACGHVHVCYLNSNSNSRSLIFRDG